MKKLTKIKEIIGKTEEEAEQMICGEGLFLRLTKKDGKCFTGTCDFQLNRVNIEVENGKIIDAYLG